jgi:hypothetical protein
VWQLAGKHMAQRLPESDIEVDELEVECGPTAQTMIKDDTITMSKRVYCAPPPPPPPPLRARVRVRAGFMRVHAFDKLPAIVFAS